MEAMMKNMMRVISGPRFDGLKASMTWGFRKGKQGPLLERRFLVLGTSKVKEPSPPHWPLSAWSSASLDPFSGMEGTGCLAAAGEGNCDLG